VRKRRSVRGLIIATVSLVVILAAALVVKSLAAGNPGPGSDSSSFALPGESNYALLSGADNPSFTSGASSSFTGVQDTSATVVPPSPAEAHEYLAIGDLEFDPLWYGQSRSVFAPLATGWASSAPSGASLGGYGSSLGAMPFSRRSGWGAGGFSGAGGGGFPSSGGGTPSSAQNSLLDSSSNGGLSDGTTASIVGAPLLPAQAQGNPSFGGVPVSGVTFPFAQFPGLGVAGTPALNAGGSTASATQLQEPVPVPEPSTVLLLGCGLAIAVYRQRRRLDQS
jgi:hypothetical protein